MKRLKKHKILLISTGIAACLAVFALIAAHVTVERRNSRVWLTTDEIEARDVGLVLGTSPKGKYGPNLYYNYRINAAVELYFAGKVKKLLVSGDNGRKGYNEPEDMKQSLMKRGVPAEDIVCDYAGFRTLDSVVRADKVFGQKKIIIISQAFHCKRAIFLADHKGIDAIGFAARTPSAKYNFVSGVLRETAARLAATVDLLILRKPRYLGKPETVFSAT